ncbi:MAG TPA: hypothetical protein VJT73_15355 [Polyangiaceae bacterium]|nr:hypothetical protein [Polyangiaceae bacterium]
MLVARSVIVLLIAASAALFGCDKRELDPEPPRPRTEARLRGGAADPQPSRELQLELESLAAKANAAEVDPVAPSGDLKSDVEAFTTLDACAAARAVKDPLLGDAIGALGYDTLARDACRILEAMKTRDRN